MLNQLNIINTSFVFLLFFIIDFRIGGDAERHRTQAANVWIQHDPAQAA